jgi:hypothetical protein
MNFLLWKISDVLSFFLVMELFVATGRLYRDFQVFPSSDITVLYLNRVQLRHCAVWQCECPVCQGPDHGTVFALVLG